MWRQCEIQIGSSLYDVSMDAHPPNAIYGISHNFLDLLLPWYPANYDMVNWNKIEASSPRLKMSFGLLPRVIN